MTRAWWLGLVMACGPAPIEEVAPSVEEVAPPIEEAPAPAAPGPAPTRLVAFHPDDLAGDLSAVTELDLGFSATDPAGASSMAEVAVSVAAVNETA